MLDAPPNATGLTDDLISVADAVVDLSGEEAGKASLLKIIGNVLIMTTMEACAEINVFAEKTGLGVKNAQKLIDNFSHAAAHTIYSSKMNSGAYYKEEVRVESPAVNEFLLLMYRSQWLILRKPVI